MKNRFLLLVLIITPFLWSCQKKPVNLLSLAGEWRFHLDMGNVGIQEEWHSKMLEQRITLPGSLAENGYGDDPSLQTKWIGSVVDSSWFKLDKFAKYRKPDNFKVPMWLTPSKYYRGVAWYQKEIEIPSSWKGTSIELFLERCHWETQVWIDDKKIGSQNSLGTPHTYDLEKLTPGKHTVTVRVNNDLIIDVGINSHSVSDHTQTNKLEWHNRSHRAALTSPTPVGILTDISGYRKGTSQYSGEHQE